MVSNLISLDSISSAYLCISSAVNLGVELAVSVSGTRISGNVLIKPLR